MIGLVMAGGRGSRMEFPAPEKLLLEYEKPIIFHVIDSLNDSHCFS
jgi:adenosylcobinamide-phosphate guanylyltransferase